MTRDTRERKIGKVQFTNTDGEIKEIQKLETALISCNDIFTPFAFNGQKLWRIFIYRVYYDGTYDNIGGLEHERLKDLIVRGREISEYR